MSDPNIQRDANGNVVNPDGSVGGAPAPQGPANSIPQQDPSGPEAPAGAAQPTGDQVRIGSAAQQSNLVQQAQSVQSSQQPQQPQPGQTATQGLDPNYSTPADGLDESTKEELYEEAQNLGIDGRSTMNKDELLNAVRAARNTNQ